MNNIKLPELLSPAGNFEKLRAALLYGADAVYLGGTHFGMRSSSDNFDAEQLAEAIKYTHKRGKKLYVTVNTMPHADEYPALEQYLALLGELRPDALIVADLGVFSLAKQLIPHIPLHISTQASIVSPAAALAYASLGAERLVLARELSLREIIAIRAALPPTVEIEAFVHGSMCVSYSGRCMLSNHLTGRDANRGKCTQPCRWNYYIREEKRPDDIFPVEQTPEGTFIMSSKDMCTIEHIPELVRAGISSFKIEGRVKSAYYTAVVTNAYRMALDAFAADPDGYRFDPALMAELESVSHREYCSGYYFDDPKINPQLASTTGYIRDKAYIATALAPSADDGLCLFIQRNKVSVGDRVEVISPGKVGRGFTVTEILDTEKNPVESAPHPAMQFYVRPPFPVAEGDIMRAAGEQV